MTSHESRMNIFTKEDLDKALFYLNGRIKFLKTDPHVPQKFYHKERFKLKNRINELTMANLLLKNKAIDHFFSEDNQNVNVEKTKQNAKYYETIIRYNQENFYNNLCSGSLLSNKMMVWSNWINIMAYNCINETQEHAQFTGKTYYHWLSCVTMPHYSDMRCPVIFNRVIGMLMKSYSLVDNWKEFDHKNGTIVKYQTVEFTYKMKIEEDQPRGLFVKPYYTSLCLLQDVACGLMTKEESQKHYLDYSRKNSKGLVYSRAITIYNTLNCIFGIQTKKIDDDSCLVSFGVML